MIKLNVLVAVGSVIADSRRHGCEDASAEPSGYVRINVRIKNANRKHGTTGQWHDSIVSGSGSHWDKSRTNLLLRPVPGAYTIHFTFASTGSWECCFEMWLVALGHPSLPLSPGDVAHNCMTLLYSWVCCCLQVMSCSSQC